MEQFVSCGDDHFPTAFLFFTVKVFGKLLLMKIIELKMKIIKTLKLVCGFEFLIEVEHFPESNT